MDNVVHIFSQLLFYNICASCALISAYYQFPALWAEHGGLTPLTPKLEHAPIFDELSLPFDLIYEFKLFIAIICCFFSIYLCFSVLFLHKTNWSWKKIIIACLMFVARQIYVDLHDRGGQFMSFQWDTFLLETSFVYISWSICSGLLDILLGKPTTLPSFALLARFIGFKISFQSGVLKLGSQGRSWWTLTALDFHYASQPLPTPLAWFAAQQPPWFGKISVGLMFVFQLFCAPYLLSPSPVHQLLSAGGNLVLQILIITTGNYNFFNLNTICMIFGAEIISYTFFRSTRKKVKHLCENESWIMFFLSYIIPIVFLTATTLHLNKSKSGEQWLGIDFLVFDFYSVIYVIVHLTTLVSIIQVVYNEVFCHHKLPKAMIRKIVFRIGHFVSSILSLSILVLLAWPLHTLYAGKVNPSFYSPTSIIFTSPQIRQLWIKQAQGIQMSSTYGLFRQMTGVGASTRFPHVSLEEPSKSIVERPEVIIEGLFEMTTQEGSRLNVWKEVEFFHKPGSLTRAPTFVAPHQPRLDWQLWFAALGNYQRNPYIIHLMYKLLSKPLSCRKRNPRLLSCKNNDPIWDVVPEIILENNNLIPSSPRLLKMRAKLYHYDFTRINTSWNRPVAYHPDGILSSNDTRWWVRKFHGEYIPTVEKQHLEQFIEAQGWGKSEKKTVCTNLLCEALMSNRKLMREEGYFRGIWCLLGGVFPVLITAILCSLWELFFSIFKTNQKQKME